MKRAKGPNRRHSLFSAPGSDSFGEDEMAGNTDDMVVEAIKETLIEEPRSSGVGAKAACVIRARGGRVDSARS